MGLTKKGLSDIVTNVLIILLVLVAVGLIWFFVQPFLGSTRSLTTETYTIALEIVPGSAVADATTHRAALGVRRLTGKGDLVALNAILEDSAQASRSFRQNVTMAELETRSLNIDYTGSGLGTIAAISIAPIVRLADGTELVGHVADRELVAAGQVSVPGSGNPLNILGINSPSGTYSVSYLPYPLTLDFSLSGTATSCKYSFNNGGLNVTIPGCAAYYAVVDSAKNWALTLFALDASTTARQTSNFVVDLCVGDVENSGKIDWTDESKIISNDGRSGCSLPTVCAGNVDGSDKVDGTDLVLFYASLQSENQKPNGGCSGSCFLDCDMNDVLSKDDQTCFSEDISNPGSRTHPDSYYDVDDGSNSGTPDGRVDGSDKDYFDNNLYVKAHDQASWPGCPSLS